MWNEPQADFSEIHLACWRIIARDKTANLTIIPSAKSEMQPKISTGLAYDAMFVVLDEWQKAAICQNY